MIDTILYVLAGAFIGWATPQPAWAKATQAKVTDFIKSLFIKSLTK